MRRARKATIFAEAPDGRIHEIRVPPALAWCCARGIARETHYGVVLLGQFGVASVRSDGRSEVFWRGPDGHVQAPVQYDERTTACIC